MTDVQHFIFYMHDEFENTKVVIRICKPKDRQHNYMHAVETGHTFKLYFILCYKKKFPPIYRYSNTCIWNRLLEDESIKRTELEKLKKEQEHLLQLERERREGLEDQWEEKDKILEEARNKLLTLESERLEASEKLQVNLFRT